MNGHHEKSVTEVVTAAVLNATYPGGSEQSGSAYVYRTQGAGLFLNDAANRWIVPLKSMKLGDIRAEGMLSGKAQTSVSDCPANSP